MFVSYNIKNSSSIGPKKAQQIVQKAIEFESEMKLEYLGKEVDLKSILGIMSLAVLEDAEIRITSYGEDANESIEEIKKIIEKEN